MDPERGVAAEYWWSGVVERCSEAREDERGWSAGERCSEGVELRCNCSAPLCSEYPAVRCLVNVEHCSGWSDWVARTVESETFLGDGGCGAELTGSPITRSGVRLKSWIMDGETDGLFLLSLCSAGTMQLRPSSSISDITSANALSMSIARSSAVRSTSAFPGVISGRSTSSEVRWPVGSGDQCRVVDSTEWTLRVGRRGGGCGEAVSSRISTGSAALRRLSASPLLNLCAGRRGLCSSNGSMTSSLSCSPVSRESRLLLSVSSDITILPSSELTLVPRTFNSSPEFISVSTAVSSSSGVRPLLQLVVRTRLTLGCDAEISSSLVG